MKALTVTMGPFVLCDSLYGHSIMGSSGEASVLIFYGRVPLGLFSPLWSC